VPLYDYVCGSCGVRTEVMHGVHAVGPEACPSCGRGPMKKAMNAPAIHFKGTGWAKKERAASSVTKAAARSADASSGGGSAGDRGGESAPDQASGAGSDSRDTPAAPAAGGSETAGSTSPGPSSSGSSSSGSSSAGSQSAGSGSGEG
jgi:putative FmdB family regulatory protein